MAIPSHKLQYLYETYKRGSMRSASEHLGVAVSSISRQISQVEAELGIPLIEHGRRSVKLTEAGKLAIDYYRNTAVHQSQFVEQLRDLKDSRTGRIDLAVGEGFVTQALSETLALFNARFPTLTLSVQVGGTNSIAERVADDEAHIGLVFDGKPHDRLTARITLPQPLYCVVSTRHKLAMRSSVAMSEMAEHSLCLLNDRFRIRQLLSEAEAEAGLLLTPAMVTDSIGLMKASVATGKFATLLPTLPISAEVSDGILVAIPVENQTLTRTTVSLVTRSGRQLPKSVLALLTMIEGALKRWTALDAGALAQEGGD